MLVALYMFVGIANEDGGVLFPPVVVVLYIAFATLIRHLVTVMGTVDATTTIAVPTNRAA